MIAASNDGRRDRQVKLALYASAGIPDFWIVNLKVREVEIHRSRARDTCFSRRKGRVRPCWCCDRDQSNMR